VLLDLVITILGTTNKLLFSLIWISVVLYKPLTTVAHDSVYTARFYTDVWLHTVEIYGQQNIDLLNRIFTSSGTKPVGLENIATRSNHEKLLLTFAQSIHACQST